MHKRLLTIAWLYLSSAFLAFFGLFIAVMWADIISQFFSVTDFYDHADIAITITFIMLVTVYLYLCFQLDINKLALNENQIIGFVFIVLGLNVISLTWVIGSIIDCECGYSNIYISIKHATEIICQGYC